MGMMVNGKAHLNILSLFHRTFAYSTLRQSHYIFTHGLSQRRKSWGKNMGGVNSYWGVWGSQDCHLAREWMWQGMSLGQGWNTQRQTMPSSPAMTTFFCEVHSHNEDAAQVAWDYRISWFIWRSIWFLACWNKIYVSNLPKFPVQLFGMSLLLCMETVHQYSASSKHSPLILSGRHFINCG